MIDWEYFETLVMAFGAAFYGGLFMWQILSNVTCDEKEDSANEQEVRDGDA